MRVRLNVPSRIKQIVLLRREELHPLSPLPLSEAPLSPLPLPVDCCFCCCARVCAWKVHIVPRRSRRAGAVGRSKQSSERNQTVLSKKLWKSVDWISTSTMKSTGCTRHLIMHRQNSQTPSATPSAPGRATACKTSSHRRP